jgi:Uma2 family endonuclease
MSNRAVSRDRITVKEFAELELEAPEGERWELIGGQIVRMMTGGTIAHNRIVQNLVVSIRTGLRRLGSRCDVFSENVKFEQADEDTATYPDVIVTCEPIRNEAQAINRPVVLIEVLSRTSAARDRVEKWQRYAKAGSLGAYILVEQREPLVEIYSRQGTSQTWAWSRLEGLGGTVELAALDLAIPVAEIYDRVFDTGAA